MDFCEGDEGFVCVGSSGKTAKVSSMPSPEKPPPLTPKNDKVPALLPPLRNGSALVTNSEDDSDANETFHDAETISDKAHESMPPSQLSPRRTRVSGPNSSSNVRPLREPVRALVAGGGAVQTTATTAQSSLLASSLGGCDRTSANSGTFRTTTTVATLRLLSRGDSSSMAPPVSETLYWDNKSSVGSQYYPTASWHPSCVIGSRVRLGAMI